MSDNPYNKYQPSKPVTVKIVHIPHPSDLYGPEMLVLYNVFDATGRFCFQAPLYMLVNILSLHQFGIERIRATATITNPCLLNFNGRPLYYQSAYHEVYNQMFVLRAPETKYEFPGSI